MNQIFGSNGKTKRSFQLKARRRIGMKAWSGRRKSHGVHKRQSLGKEYISHRGAVTIISLSTIKPPTVCISPRGTSA